MARLAQPIRFLLAALLALLASSVASSSSLPPPSCFADPSNNATLLLSGLAALHLPSPFISNSMTHEFCRAHCAQLEFKYYGLLGADKCSCADQPPPLSLQIPIFGNITQSQGVNGDACAALPCAGDHQQLCGPSDPSTTLVYETGVEIDANERSHLHNPPASVPAPPSTSSAIATDTFTPESSATVSSSSHSAVPISAVTGGFVGAGIALSTGLLVGFVFFLRRRRRLKVEAEEREEEKGMIRASTLHQLGSLSGSVQRRDLSRNTSAGSHISQGFTNSLLWPGKSLPNADRATPPIPEEAVASPQITLRSPSIAHTFVPSPAYPSARPVSSTLGTDAEPPAFQGYRASWVDPRFSTSTSDLPALNHLRVYSGIYEDGEMVIGSMESLQDAVDYAPRLRIRNMTEDTGSYLSDRTDSFLSDGIPPS